MWCGPGRGRLEMCAACQLLKLTILSLPVICQRFAGVPVICQRFASGPPMKDVWGPFFFATIRTLPLNRYEEKETKEVMCHLRFVEKSTFSSNLIINNIYYYNLSLYSVHFLSKQLCAHHDDTSTHVDCSALCNTDYRESAHTAVAHHTALCSTGPETWNLKDIYNCCDLELQFSF